MYSIITCITSLHVHHHYMYIIITCTSSLHVHHSMYIIITCITSLHVHHHLHVHVHHHYTCMYNIITCITSLHVQHHYMYKIIACTASLDISKRSRTLSVANLSFLEFWRVTNLTVLVTLAGACFSKNRCKYLFIYWKINYYLCSIQASK